MFKKILIANRGEIACRIIKTARKMGIKTVAVYSDADAAALHVEMADERVAIGPAPSAQSYLVIDKIVDACKKTGAEAVHPGYGFLSEREAFADALAANGIAFIGPNKLAIAAMGDKIESKKLASKAKVSTVPGYIGEIHDLKEAARIAKEIGYPVMVKASAGGGGKGLRIVNAESELAQAIQSSQHEAKASFGDDRIFIEKYVTEPRHIEIQVLGDKHGNIIHLGERECSIQRRHQKVIEEAPSPFLDEKTRAAMGAQAVALAKAVNYESAGTVEFIVDKDRNFYFLEMNTRLQVEHPVTELITGFDLVEQMIRVANGEKLAIRQEDVKLKGWAIESRIYAEDPYRNFLPSTGRLVRYRPPAESTNAGKTIRNDTGVYEGGEISIFYDPMIAKLCAHAATREQAIDLMSDALDHFHIEGIRHNIAFLQAVMTQPRFRSGRLSTNFIAEEFKGGFEGAELTPDLKDRMASVAVFMHLREEERKRRISGQIDSRAAVPREWTVSINNVDALAVRTMTEGRDVVAVRLGDGKSSRMVEVESSWKPGESVFVGEVAGASLAMQVNRKSDQYMLMHRGATAAISVRRPRIASLAGHMLEKPAPDTSKFLLCPMPGLVISIAAQVGQEVKAGETLAVVEAMKMENVLRAERDGVVKKVSAKPGDSLPVDAVILEFE
ncbi:MAG: acetyl/propionyl/methylcrotonyl-CoA carboxylase subunit alpha [Micropepsaceae bacterium]